MRPHAECANTGQKCGSIEYASSGSHAVVAGFFRERPTGAVEARELDVVHLGNRAEDAVELGHDRLVEMLIGDL